MFFSSIAKYFLHALILSVCYSIKEVRCTYKWLCNFILGLIYVADVLHREENFFCSQCTFCVLKSCNKEYALFSILDYTL